MMRGLGFIVVGVVLALTTMTRVSTWQDERRLWAEAALQSPLKPRPWLNLGRQWHLAGDLEQAAVTYRHAADVAASPARSPDERRIGLAYAEHNLASVLIAQQQWGEARDLIAALRTRHPRFQPAAILERALPPDRR